MTTVLTEIEDFFNAKGTRNAENTEEEEYNCAGYALNTFSWYLPYYGTSDDEEMEIFYLIEEGYSKEEIYEMKLTEYTNKMLMNFPKLRLLSSPTEVKSNERLIYFRIFYEELYDIFNGEIHTDFHYRYFENGKWWEKCGGTELREVPMEEMEGTWKCGWNEYDSRTVYLALKMED